MTGGLKQRTTADDIMIVLVVVQQTDSDIILCYKSWYLRRGVLNGDLKCQDHTTSCESKQEVWLKLQIIILQI